jgi:hypothetical protein
MSFHIEYEYHDELDRGLPMVVEYTKAGHRLILATFKTLAAAHSAIVQLEGYGPHDAGYCACEFDHLCNRHYFEHYGEHREAA